MQLQDALLEPKRLRLAVRLRDHVDQSEGKHGYKLLRDENANWYECAKVALDELEHLGKATNTCFAIARRIAHEHGLKIDTQTSFKLGGYCLDQIILEDWAWVEWHPDKTCYVVMLKDEVLRKTPSSNNYTSFTPFAPWTAPYSDDGHQLVKPSKWTEWEPPDWHFTGKAPSAGETRTWHPFIERLFDDDDRDAAMPWLFAVNKLERNRYRINKSMLQLIKDLDEHFPMGYVDKSASKYKKPSGPNKIKKEKREKFDRIMIEAGRLDEGGEFYQRCHLDHRGRIYLSRSVISYQGDDHERSLIEWSNGVPLDDVFVPCIEYDRLEKPYPVSEGFKWLLLHAANLYEVSFDKSKLVSPFVDGKSPITDQRIDVAIEHLDEWVHYANNPLDTILGWDNNDGEPLDDPLQFIRACMELRDALEHEEVQNEKQPKKLTKKRTERLKEELIETDRDLMEVMGEQLDMKMPFVSHIMVEQDQSNSVIQHLAMIYGSKTLAGRCNLIEPVDFYGSVAEEWNIGRYDLSSTERRKIVKAIVVPRCYTAGKERIAEDFSKLPIECLKDQTEGDLEDLANEGIQLLERNDIAPEVKQFRLEVGRALRALNLQASDSVDWSLPSGFEVHLRPEIVRPRFYKITRSKELPYPKAKPELKAYEKTNRLSKKKVMTSACSAIIHSIDGCLAQLVLFHSNFDVCCIHDAFACHAANVGKLRDEFRRNMAVLHGFHRPYMVWQRDVAGVPLPDGLLADRERVRQLAEMIELSTDMQEYEDLIG